MEVKESKSVYDNINDKYFTMLNYLCELVRDEKDRDVLLKFMITKSDESEFLNLCTFYDKSDRFYKFTTVANTGMSTLCILLESVFKTLLMTPTLCSQYLASFVKYGLKYDIVIFCDMDEESHCNIYKVRQLLIDNGNLEPNHKVIIYGNFSCFTCKCLKNIVRVSLGAKVRDPVVLKTINTYTHEFKTHLELLTIEANM